MKRLPEWLVNLGVSAASVLIFLAFCELIVFRFVWPASDVPANAFVDDVVRYAPNQRGVWRVRDEIATPYAINRQGWNSGAGDYRQARVPGVTRIAVVGDSFVESLQVAHDRSFGERLPGFLAEMGAIEVYRFAISGAPMSQYLHMIEREVGSYRPDWIVVLLTHNDFDESFRFKAGRYTSSFRKLEVKDGRVLREIPPRVLRPGATEWLRRSATARFLLYRWQVRPQFLVNWLAPPAHADDRVAANVRIGEVLAAEPDVRGATDYVLGRIAANAKSLDAKLLVAMDGDRQAIYEGREASEALKLNGIAGEAAARHDTPFLDLHPVFAADWKANRRNFQFESDYHWNEHGQAVVAGAIAQAMRRTP